MDNICNNCGTSTMVCSIDGEIEIAHANADYTFNVKGTYLSEKGMRESIRTIMSSFKILTGDYGDRLIYDVKCKSCDEKVDSGTFTRYDM